jgi:endonuclease IV
MVLGVHCPVSGGFDAALRHAQALGCAAMQIFPYKRHELPTPAELAGFRSSRERSAVRRLLACVDTAHAWAAGFDVASAEGMLRFLSRLHGVEGAQNVLAFHLNDTRALLGS